MVNDTLDDSVSSNLQHTHPRGHWSFSNARSFLEKVYKDANGSLTPEALTNMTFKDVSTVKVNCHLTLMPLNWLLILLKSGPTVLRKYRRLMKSFPPSYPNIKAYQRSNYCLSHCYFVLKTIQSHFTYWSSEEGS